MYLCPSAVLSHVSLRVMGEQCLGEQCLLHVKGHGAASRAGSAEEGLDE